VSPGTNAHTLRAKYDWNESMSNKRRLLQDDDEDEEDAGAIDLTGNSSPLPKVRAAVSGKDPSVL